jgi:hypothetical protein
VVDVHGIRHQDGGLARWLPLSGIAFVAIVVITFAVVAGDTPESDASAATVAAFYRDHSDASYVAAFLLAAASPLVVLFGVGLARALWSEDQGPLALWPTVLTIGSGLGAMGFILAAHSAFAVVDGVDHLTPATLQGVNVIGSSSWLMFNSALGIMLLGAAGSLLTHGARLLGWPALVLGIALFIPYADFVAFLLSGIWIIVMSVVQLRRPALPGADAHGMRVPA